MKSANKNIFAYALLALPIAVLGVPLYIYIPTYYATTYHVPLFELGLAIFIARALDIFSDPLIGKLSDRFGERKKMIALGSVVMLGGFTFLVHPFITPNAWYLCALLVATYLGWSLANIPYLALSAEIFGDALITTRLSFARESMMIFGLFIALSLPYISGVAHDSAQTLDALLLYLTLILPLALLFFWLFLKVSTQKKEQKDFFAGIQTFFTTFVDFKKLIVAFFLNSLANSFPATLFLLFVSAVLQDASQSSLLLMSYFFSGIIAFPLWMALAKKYDKKSLWIASMLLASAAFIFVPFLSSGDTALFLLICIFSGLSLGADMALPSALQADIAIASKNENNELTGVLFGIWAMVTKLSLALGAASAFFILGLVGFDPKAPNQQAVLMLSLLYAFVPVVLKLLAIFFLTRLHR